MNKLKVNALVIEPLKKVFFKDINLSKKNNDEIEVKWAISSVCNSERRRYNLTKSKDDKEHVTKFLYRNSKKFIIKPVPIDKKFQINKKLDIDRKSDLKNIIKLVKNNKISINSSDQKIIN